MQPGQSVCYSIDRSNRLRDLSPEWDQFAAANDAPQLSAVNVLGTSLLGHISDSTLCFLTEQLVEYVRRSGKSLELSFNCDSPATIREMRMHISRAAAGGVDFRSTLVAQRSREPVHLLDVQKARSGDFVRVCSWCKRSPAEERWRPLDELVGESSWMQVTPVPRITHGICPDCEASLRESI